MSEERVFVPTEAAKCAGKAYLQISTHVTDDQSIEFTSHKTG